MHITHVEDNFGPLKIWWDGSPYATLAAQVVRIIQLLKFNTIR